MLQAGGIDKLVEQKADAYRSNPQALQKRYSQNQELMDLLAMQKLKTEKETAARDMQLKAEQTPSTIAEQYEQQLVGMNKNEMAQQTAGIMGERQKKAQQKQQAMGIPPQQAQQRPPMPQAASQGIASQPRPNMQGMAKGGIIGFDKGGSVTQEEIDAFRKSAPMSRSGGMSVAEKMELTDDEIRQILIKKRNPLGLSSSGGSQNPRSGIPRPPTATKAAPPTAATKAAPPTAATKAAPSVGANAAQFNQRQPITDAQAGSQEVMPVDTPVAEATKKLPYTGPVEKAAPQGPKVAAPNYADGIDTQLKNILDTKAPDTSGLSKKMLTDALNERSPEFMGKVKERMELDPEAKSKETQKRLASSDSEKGGLGIKAYEEKLADYLRQKEDLDRSQLDPEAVARERANAGIRGLIEGGTGRGASIARGKFDANVAKRRRDVINEQRDMFVKNKNAAVQIIDKINSGTADALKMYTDDVNNSMKLFSTITEKDMDLHQKEADRLYQANQDGIKNRIDALRVSVEANMQRLLKEQANEQQMATSLKGFISEYIKLKEDHQANYRTAIDAANQKLFDPESTEAEIAEANATLAEIQGIFESLVDKTKLDDLISTFQEKITGISSGSKKEAGNPQGGSGEERADALLSSTGV